MSSKPYFDMLFHTPCLFVHFLINDFPHQRAQQSGQRAQSQIAVRAVLPRFLSNGPGRVPLPGSSQNRDCRGAFPPFFVNLFSQLLFQFQNIAYSEYLPAIIGPKLMQEHNLQIGGGPTKYDPEADPRVSNEFATVSFCLMAFIVFIGHIFSCR